LGVLQEKSGELAGLQYRLSFPVTDTLNFKPIFECSSSSVYYELILDRHTATQKCTCIMLSILGRWQHHYCLQLL